MAEDQGGEEVIREIGKALALASELDPQIVRSLRSAIVQAMSDYEDDTNAQAAAASIRSHLPTVSPQRLTDHEQADLEAYIARYLPPDDPREEHAPRGPRL